MHSGEFVAPAVQYAMCIALEKALSGRSLGWRNNETGKPRKYMYIRFPPCFKTG